MMKKLIAIFCCIVLLLVVNIFGIYIIPHHHECIGDGCRICADISNCLRFAADILILSVIAVFLLTVMRNVTEKAYDSDSCSPIDMRVRLNN